jgi:hypothetical protein
MKYWQRNYDEEFHRTLEINGIVNLEDLMHVLSRDNEFAFNLPYGGSICAWIKSILWYISTVKDTGFYKSSLKKRWYRITK